MSKDLDERIMIQKVHMCLKAPFYGVLMMRLKVQEVGKGVMPCDTMATDGKNLFYVADYIKNMPDVQLRGLLAHEIMHVAHGHCLPTRIKHREHRKWNTATDAAIDHLLKDAGFDVPDSFADKPEFAWARNLSAEAIYAQLPDQPKNGGGGRGGQVMPGGADGMNEMELKIAVQQAAMAQQSHDRRKGTTTGWLKQFIEEMNDPKIPWQEQLRKFMAPLVPSDYTWARPNRRYIAQNIYLPGHLKEGIGEGVIYFDSSGSCIGDWPQFCAELISIFEDTKPERVHVVMCDSSVKSIQTYEAGEMFEPTVSGGGGSDFRPAFKSVNELGAEIKWAVVLSDMEIDFPPNAPHYPVIGVSTTKRAGPDWMQNIFMER